MYFIANWKSNKLLEEATEWFNQINLPTIDHTIVVCPPMPYLKVLYEQANSGNLNVSFGVQDISPFPFGAYTGAIAAPMVSQWAKYAIVGHSERRKYFHETDQEVANKVTLALDNNITPVVCIDEPYLTSQLSALTTEQLKSVIVAYEPVSAIGSGQPDTPDHAESVAKEIKQEAKADVPVLYGGSVKPDNVAAYLQMPSIEGVLVGGASLEPETWAALVDHPTS